MDTELSALIHRLNKTPLLDPGRARELSRAQTVDWIAQAFESGEVTTNPASALSILKQPDEDTFRTELRAVDNDLPRQISIVNESLDLWLGQGSTPPPYYPWRIAIILSKEKRADEEKAFLAAWCRHFGRIVGGRYESLADRARKRGLTV